MRYINKLVKILFSTLLVFFLFAPDGFAIELSKEQAFSSLEPPAIHKVATDLRKRIFNKTSNDLIVEFVQNTPRQKAESLESAKRKFVSNKQRILSILNPGDYQKLREYDALPMSFLRINNRDALVNLLNHPDVKAVYEDKTFQHFLTESLPLIGQPQAYALGYGGAGTTVAVLDTGVDYTNAAFGSCTSPGVPAGCRVVAAFDTAVDDGQLDDNGHGTNVSAIVTGVAPDNKIATIDVFNGAVGYSNDIIAAINWAISHQVQYNIVAMNLSLGGAAKNTAECAASVFATPFSNARTANIIPVVATGNSAFTDGIAEPACVPGTVRVGAVYDSNIGYAGWGNGLCTDSTTFADKVTCFSNGGNLVTLLAPGALITAAGITEGGTSQATPHVAGAISVLRAPNAAPGDTLNQTVSRLTSTGTLITDQRNNIQTPRLNLFAAVTSLPLAAPSTLSATAVSVSQINLGWTDNSNNETGFKIERKTGAGGTWAEITTVTANATSYSDMGLTASTSYFYRVRAANANGNSSYSNESSATTFNEAAPVAPSSLSAATVSSTQINLSWTDNSNNETGFKIKRKTGAGGTWSEIATLAANVISYSSTGLSPATQYFYRVYAINAIGNSNDSNEANATTLDVAPAAPSNLIAAPASPTQINLNWTDNSGNETGFNIERKTKTVKLWTQIAMVASDVTAYSNPGLKTGGTYLYRVRATNAIGNSPYSNEISATLSKPKKPTRLIATVVSSTQINLSWADNSSNETEFKLERKNGAGSWLQIDSLAADTISYSDTGLTPVSKYLYRVRAANPVGNTSYSNQARGTTSN